MCNGMQIIRLHRGTIREIVSGDVRFISWQNKNERKLTKGWRQSEGWGDGEAVKMRKTTQEFAIHEKRRRRRRRPCVSHRMRDLI